jgi:hypothetical protein
VRAIVLPLLLLFSLSTPSFACEEGATCDKCAKEPEFGWNPPSQFVTARLQRFYSLEEKIQAAYEAGNDADVKSLTREYLALAVTYRCNWNYGNAVHDANRYLGLASLRSGKVDEAAAFLVLSGKSPGSPQLNSFGPELDLANRLLKFGKVVQVKEYLTGVKTFWRMDNGQVDIWLSAIDRGETPELDRHESAKPSFGFMALDVFLVAWPTIAVLCFMILGRNRLARKWTFLIAGVGSGYLTLVLLNAGAIRVVPMLAERIESTSFLLLFSVLFMPAFLALAAPALVVFLAFRYFSKR